MKFGIGLPMAGTTTPQSAGELRHRSAVSEDATVDFERILSQLTAATRPALPPADTRQSMPIGDEGGPSDPAEREDSVDTSVTAIIAFPASVTDAQPAARATGQAVFIRHPPVGLPGTSGGPEPRAVPDDASRSATNAVAAEGAVRLAPESSDPSVTGAPSERSAAPDGALKPGTGGAAIAASGAAGVIAGGAATAELPKATAPWTATAGQATENRFLAAVASPDAARSGPVVSSTTAPRSGPSAETARASLVSQAPQHARADKLPRFLTARATMAETGPGTPAPATPAVTGVAAATVAGTASLAASVQVVERAASSIGRGAMADAPMPVTTGASIAGRGEVTMPSPVLPLSPAVYFERQIAGSLDSVPDAEALTGDMGGLGSASPLTDRSGPALVQVQPGAPGAAQMPRDIAMQMMVGLSETVDGQTEITLNPEELGRVKLRLSTLDNAITLAIVAERPETADMLRRHIDMLAQEFRALGFGDISFNFGDDHDKSTDDEQPRASDTAPAIDPLLPQQDAFLFLRQDGLDLRM